MINVMEMIVKKHDGATSSVREIDHYDGRPDDTAADDTWDDDEDAQDDDKSIMIMMVVHSENSVGDNDDNHDCPRVLLTL